MKYSLSIIAFVLAATFAHAQSPESIAKWTFTTKKKDAKTYELIATAVLPKAWHLYSQSTPKGGPIPTKFIYKTNPLLKLDGSTQEAGSLKTVHDPVFDVDVKYYNDKVDFTQSVTLKTAAKTSLSGTIDYMVCNEEKCFPAKQSFEVKLQ